jgi:hypothetical protein
MILPMCGHDEDNVKQLSDSANVVEDESSQYHNVFGKKLALVSTSAHLGKGDWDLIAFSYRRSKKVTLFKPLTLIRVKGEWHCWTSSL